MAQLNKNTLQIIIAGCVIFAVLLFSALIINLIKIATLSSKERELKALLIQKEAELQRLDEAVSEKSTNAFVDSYVRTYLNMCGEDEVVFIAK